MSLEKRIGDLVLHQEGDNRLETSLLNRKSIKKDNNNLESTRLELKGVFSISGRDSLNDSDSKKLIKEIDNLIQQYTNENYHVRLVIRAIE